METLLNKDNEEQLEAIASLSFTNYLSIWSENLLFHKAFSNFFHTYDVTTIEIIHPITFRKFAKHPIKVLRNRSITFF